MSDPFDPEASEEKRRGSQYVSRKDVRVVGIALLILAACAYPIYRYGLGQVNSSLCLRNMHKISEAMLTYIKDSDDHFPYAYETEENGSTKVRVHKGLAYTWQWVVEPYTRDGWSAYTCPAAMPSEHTTTGDPGSGKTNISDYGMLNAYSGVAVSDIANPDSCIVIGETAKSGANDTFDPLPLWGDTAIIQNDGFVIGFDNNQDYPDLQTRSATRLAYPKTSSGNFSHDSDGRHPDGLHFLSAGGKVRTGDGAMAQVIPLMGTFGPWSVPKKAP